MVLNQEPTRTLKPPKTIRLTSKGISFGHAHRLHFLHHLRIDAVAVRPRLEDDVGEDHGLAGLQLHHARERGSPLRVEVVADALLVVERAVLQPHCLAPSGPCAGRPSGSSSGRARRSHRRISCEPPWLSVFTIHFPPPLSARPARPTQWRRITWPRGTSAEKCRFYPGNLGDNGTLCFQASGSSSRFRSRRPRRRRPSPRRPRP